VLSLANATERHNKKITRNAWAGDTRILSGNNTNPANSDLLRALFVYINNIVYCKYYLFFRDQSILPGAAQKKKIECALSKLC
jgi:hypothetical protein